MSVQQILVEINRLFGDTSLDHEATFDAMEEIAIHAGAFADLLLEAQR